MQRSFLFIVFIASLIVGCEKIPPHENQSLNVKFQDLHGKPLVDLYAGLEIKMVSDDFKKLAQQQIDLKKEGVLIFDKIIAPIDSVGLDFIIARVPRMDYIQALSLPITLRIRNQLFPICNVCLIYRPTVRGRILTGFSSGASDGTFQMPAEMTLDATGNMYVIDQRDLHDIVLRVTPTGEVSTFTGASGEFGRLVGIGINNISNKMYLADATVDQVFEVNMSSPGSISVLAGSGVEGNIDGTGITASFRFGNRRVDDFGSNEPGQGLALDAAGNIYVGELTTLSLGSQIRKITPAGVTSIVPGSTYFSATAEEESARPSGLVVAPSNDIWYVTGESGLWQGVVRVNADGSTSRVAGKESFEGLNDGVGTLAQFSYPKAIATNGTNFYVADGTNGALRRVNASGEVITLAGVGHFNTNRFRGGGFQPPIEGSWIMPNPFALFLSADFYEIAASSIRMDQVGGIAVRNSGRLIYISDHGYRCIWEITIG